MHIGSGTMQEDITWLNEVPLDWRIVVCEAKVQTRHAHISQCDTGQFHHTLASHHRWCRKVQWCFDYMHDNYDMETSVPVFAYARRWDVTLSGHKGEHAHFPFETLNQLST